MALLTSYLINAREEQIAPHIQGDVLDLGCGQAQVWQRHGHRMKTYTGVERDPGQVARLRAAFPDADFHCRNLDEDKLDLPGRFDCVLMVALIEHLFNQKHVMDQVAGVLKPKGVLVLTTPTPFGNDIVHRLGARLGFFSKAAVDDHIVIYNRHRLGLMAREVGLRVSGYHTFQMGCNQLATLTLDGDAS